MLINMILNNYPVRAPVSWYVKEGNFVSIVIDKKFSKIELLIAKFTKAPTKLTRNLDDMNSRLWVLMDGSNTIKEIIETMDKEFNERIYPAPERIILSIEQFLDLGLVHLLTKIDEIKWSIEPMEIED